MAYHTTRESRICKWKEDKPAAFSIGGDDSLRSQLYFAVPEMDKRGIRGTWWVNPGLGGSTNFKKEDDDWANCWIACYDDWKAAAQRGHDFANHTMHHLGVRDYADADFEIGETARIIRATNPRQKLQLFDKGGGTVWKITDEELVRILDKYDCVWGRGGGIEDVTWDLNLSAGALRGYVDTAIREGSWHHVALHGIGPECEWGGQKDGDAFRTLLDYLVEKRDQVWTGTHTEVHKYDQERSTASVELLEVSGDQMHFRLTSEKDPMLYDYPLTLRTRVPEDWRHVRVMQGNELLECRLLSEMVQFEALPGRGDIRIEFKQT